MSSMAYDTPAIRTLLRAIDTAGSKDVLSALLGVAPSAIDEWLDCGVVPLSAYLATLDIVARTSLGESSSG